MLYLERSIRPEKLPGSKAVIRFHFTDFDVLDNWWIVVNGDSVDICTSDPGKDVDIYINTTVRAADHFASRGVVRRQLAVVPYGVNQTAPAAVGDALEFEMAAWRSSGGAVLCYVSAPGSHHDQRLLARALPFIAERHRLFCVLFGDHASDAAAWAIPEVEHVRVQLATTHLPVRHYLHEADFLVLPSGDGEQPLAVLEAFCDQVPVVASRVPELAEFVEDGQTGWLFDPADPKALADTIALARESAPHSLRAQCQRARVLYQSEFTVDRMVSGYMREYARLA
jgi:glycosyltransferase involved in cell wall biosynthesis